MKGSGDIERVYEDFTARRGAIVRALTADVDKFFEECDPNQDNLCLYGNSDGSWVVGLPAQEVPAELPEPVVGINFARDGMLREDWLTLVAVHSDVWLLSVAFYWGSKLTTAEREKLFKLCNKHPTVREIVTGVKTEDGGKKEKKRKQAPAPAPAPPAKMSKPSSSARIMKPNEEITPELKGKEAELYWPDDDKWYRCEMTSINTRNKTAKVLYSTGETEELSLMELLADGHIALFD